MPVDDHPVHPKTKRNADALNGCHNRAPYSTGYWVMVREYFSDGRFVMKEEWVPFRNSAVCKYDLWHSDWGCLECKWAGGQVPSAKQLFKKEEECND